MLAGIDPIIIFQFKKLAPSLGAVLSKIPVVSDQKTLIEMPPIPIYLSEKLTGIYIESEDKIVDIETDTETLSDGKEPEVSQKGISSTIAINLVARKDSLGLALLSSMIDIAFDKATSQEYSITYLHGPIIVFRGLLQSYQANQNSSNELLSIKMEITKGGKSPVKVPDVPVVPRVQGVVPVN
jgi:hypothetical protein